MSQTSPEVGVTPGADGPDRLIGDDKIAARPSGSEPSSCARTTARAWPASRSAPRLADADDGEKPARRAASALARTVGIGLAMIRRGARNGRR